MHFTLFLFHIAICLSTSKQNKTKQTHSSLLFSSLVLHLKKMSEFSLAVVKKKTQFSTLLLSNFMFFCSFILTHPLYFSYFIFFSPYLFKIFSFLSPLFVTTSLLILAFFTILRSESLDEGNDGFQCLEELEAYKIVFETSTTFEISENQDAVLDMEPLVDCVQLQDEASVHKTETLTIVTCPEPDNIFEDFSHEKKDGVVEKEVSNVMGSKISDANPNPTVKSNYGDNYNNYEPMGSMRKEKEWKRTLACKLFEERHNKTAADGGGGGGGGEGMDLLWETYESTDSNKAKLKSYGSKKGGKNGMGDYEDEDEYEEDSEGPLCCLQALKFSTGKMNLGMGMGKLKFSKAIKGFGWLHHVGSNKHGKKGY